VEPNPQLGPGSDENHPPASNDCYRRFFDHAADGLFHTSPSGQLLLANQALAKLAGYDSPGEMVASVTDLAGQIYVSAADHDRFRTALETAGVVRNFETQMRRRDGTVVWISTEAWAVPDQQGKIRYEGMIRDLTAQKRAQEAGVSSESRYLTTLEFLQEGCMIFSPDWRYLYINNVGAKHARRTREELVGHRLTDCFPGIESTEIFQAYAASMNDRAPREIESEFVHPDGTAAWYQLNIQPVPEGLSVLSQEITTRKRAEQSVVYLGEIVQSSDDAIIGKDLAGIITSWNPGAEKIFGYTAAEAIGRPMLIVFPPELVGEEADILARVARGERLRHFETVRLRKDGRRIDVSATISPIHDATGKVIGVSKIARDITLQKQQQRELQRLTRLYAALSQVNQAIVMTADRAALYPKLCQALVEFGGFRMAWIGRVDRTTRKVIAVGQWGDRFDYLASIEVSVEDRPQGHGPTGMVIREGRAYISNDAMNDPRTLPWRESAARSGFRSSATFPIREGGEVCGALCVYSDEVGFFQDREVALLEEAAGDVSYALDNLAREDARQRAEEAMRASEDRFRVLVENIREVFWLGELDPHKILYISPAYLAIWGRTPESLYAANPAWIETVHEDDRARVLHAAETQQQAGTYDETYRVVRPDGTIRWARARFSRASAQWSGQADRRRGGGRDPVRSGEIGDT
jgi:PAS domain S-box-containing protein